jgi:hypothetical protein
VWVVQCTSETFGGFCDAIVERPMKVTHDYAFGKGLRVDDVLLAVAVRARRSLQVCEVGTYTCK